jgi:hypothetical protein
VTTRRSSRANRGTNAATLLPLALGLAANITTVRPVASATTSGRDTGTMTSANLISAVRSIPRIGISAPASEVLETWEKPAPNKSRFGKCGWFGSVGADKQTNQRKNRTDLPTSYHAVAFTALTDLEWPRDATTRRDRWKPEQLAVIEPYEGDALTVTGFIVALRPQAGNTEATNCGESGEDSTDWHMALVGEFGDPEREAVVVETTPRIKTKHPNWKPASLKHLVGTPDSVRVSGFLLLDPVHKGHLGKFRRTLWEIHPIHRIEYFRAGRWLDVDDTPP